MWSDILHALFTTYGDESAPTDAEPTALDRAVDRALGLQDAPTASIELPDESLPYVPTPARVAHKLVETLGLGPSDTFVDLGAGPGRFAILVHLLSGGTTLGLEIDPSHVETARAHARRLGLERVEFRCEDIRRADLRGATAVFIQNSVRGPALAEVMARLAEAGPPRLGSLGPCSLRLAEAFGGTAEVTTLFTVP